MKKASHNAGESAPKYDPAKIEKKWQKKWAKDKLYRSKEDLKKSQDKKEKFFVLDMFPYPSGEGLHVGHPKGYIATDIISRMNRMQGKSVLHPMGFDAFGLPAENYALKMKKNPMDLTEVNVQRFKEQLELIGLDYDWSREINTTDPAYYKWTQWAFLQMYKKGLAFESFEPINWCPSCKTGLANEDVEDGRCERCGTPVEKKPLRQWVLKITDYADRLLADLEAKKIEAPLIEVTKGEFAFRSDKKMVERDCILAIVKHWEKDEYLVLSAPKFGWKTFVIGGIEKGENPTEAVEREIVEETGFTDIKIVKQLGEQIQAKHFAPHKDENRLATLTGFYVELKSGKQKKVSVAEASHQNVLWVPKQKIAALLNPKITDWAFWNRFRGNESSFSEPCFVETDEPGIVKPELPFVERDALLVIVKHWSEDKYIGLKWKKVDWQTLITGAPEDGQTPEQGAIMEIMQETGYAHPKFIRNLGKVHSKFYHVPKKVNRFAHFDILYFELADDEKKEISQNEKDIHEVVWLSKDEVSDFLTPAAHQYAWSKFQGESFKLIEESKPLLDWPNSIKELQKNWIGKSEGAELDFKIKNSDKKIKVFTTRPDTLFGVTYVVLAPEHVLVSEFLEQVENKKEVEAYIAQAKLETEIERTDAKKEKTGVELKGIKVINPANGEEVSVWISDYVLADYGTGAVMAVPAHDDRDFAFAKKFGLQIKQVIVPEFGNHADNEQFADGGCSIVFDPIAQRYAVTEDEKGFLRLPSGGIKPGEDPKACILRETEEESGLYDFKSIESLGEVNAHYHNVAKNVNRVAHATCLLIVANSINTKPVQLEDHEKKFVLKWVTPDEAVAKWQTRIDRGADHWIYLMEQAVGRLIELGIDKTNDKAKYQQGSFDGSGALTNSGKFDGKNSDEIRKDITLAVGGNWVSKYKLRDWVFSRQRYWGEPIPLIHCEKCGVVPVPEKDLPVKLPKVASYEPTGTGESPLAAIHKWVNVPCPKCKKPAKRETNTMPQWAGSSWYYLRYMDPKNNKALVDPKKEKYWAPVDLYVGGAEHATRHLIYARFWHKFLYDIGVVSTIEPFIKLQHVGLIMGEDGRKMSKRFGNVVNPDEVVKNYGADSLRLYEMFMGPFDQQIAWSTSSIVGVRRFIEKVWKLESKVVKSKVESQEINIIDRILHKTIKKVTADISAMSFNTAISTLMIAVNEITDNPVSPNRVQFEILLKLIAPFAPHVAEELWYSLGNKKSIHISGWPIFDEALTIEDEANIIVQVNGKVRASFKASKTLKEAELEAQAKAIPEVQKWLEGKSIKKVIVIKGKLVSIVVS